jgi:hypothetical protein
VLTEIRSLSTGYRRGLGNSGRPSLPKLLKRFFHGPAGLTLSPDGGRGRRFRALLLQPILSVPASSGQSQIDHDLWRDGRLDGGILQPFALTAWGYLALAFYVVFKGCLDGLLHPIHSKSSRTALDQTKQRHYPPPNTPFIARLVSCA